MTVDQMNAEMGKFLGEASSLAFRKNRDYHPDNVAMLEILQTAFETGVTVEQDLWGRVRKQMSALRRFVIEGHVESEPPASRMTDVAVYMAIMAFWVSNRRQVVEDAFAFVADNRPCETYRGTRFSDPEVGYTCIRVGKPAEERCDRCNFSIWLMNQ